MAFWKKLWLVIRGEANRAVDDLEDPEKSLDVQIEDLASQVDGFRRRVGSAMVDERRLAAELKSAADEQEKWRSRAESAVRAGDDQLAREALRRCSAEEQTVNERRQALREHEPRVTKLKDQLRQMTSQVEAAKRRRNLLAARTGGAKTKQLMAEAMSTNTGEPDRFDQVEQRVMQLEAEADVALELSGSSSSVADEGLEQRFAALDAAGPTIDESLAQMKARLLGNPEPSAEQSASTSGPRASDSNS